MHRRHAAALKALDKLAGEEGKAARRDISELRAALYGKLGWGHWQRWEQAMLLVRFPAAFPPL